MALKQAKKAAPAPKALKTVATKKAKNPETCEVVFLGPARQLMLGGVKFIRGKATTVDFDWGQDLLETAEFGEPGEDTKAYNADTAPEDVGDEYPSGGFKTREACIKFGVKRFGKGFWQRAMSKQAKRLQANGQTFDPHLIALGLLNAALREALIRAGDDAADDETPAHEAPIDTGRARTERRANGGKAKLNTKPGATVTSSRAQRRYQEEVAV